MKYKNKKNEHRLLDFIFKKYCAKNNISTHVSMILCTSFFHFAKLEIKIDTARNRKSMNDQFYLLLVVSRRLIWAGHVARMEEGRSAFKILTGKPTGKRPLGRLRR